MSRKPSYLTLMSWQELAWTPDLSLEGWPQDVTELPVRYFPNSVDPDTLVFNGLGGSPEDLEGTIEYLGRYGLTAAGIDLTYLKNVRNDLAPDDKQKLTSHALLRAGVTVMDDIDRWSNSGHMRPRNLVGPSKGGAEAILLAGLIGSDPGLKHTFYKRVGSVAAVNTIGVANKALGKGLENWDQEARARKREFVTRMADNIEAHKIEPKLDQVQVGDSVRVKNTLMFDKGAELVTGLIRSGVRIRMFSGRDDIVAPTKELEDELGRYAGIVKKINGHHASLTNAVGKKQLQTAVTWATSHDRNVGELVRRVRRSKVRARSLRP